MQLSESDEFWIEQVLRPIALIPFSKDAKDSDVVATIWSNRRYADDRQLHSITVKQVRDARRTYEKVTALPSKPRKEQTDEK